MQQQLNWVVKTFRRFTLLNLIVHDNLNVLLFVMKELTQLSLYFQHHHLIIPSYMYFKRRTKQRIKEEKLCRRHIQCKIKKPTSHLFCGLPSNACTLVLYFFSYFFHSVYGQIRYDKKPIVLVLITFETSKKGMRKSLSYMCYHTSC